MKFKELIRHKHHKMACVTYIQDGEDINVSIECENCQEVIITADKEVIK